MQSAARHYRDPLLRVRVNRFSRGCWNIYSLLPRLPLAHVLGSELFHVSGHVSQLYREAHHAQAEADYLALVTECLRHLERTSYWLELLEKTGCLNGIVAQSQRQEAEELKRTFTAIAHKDHSH